MNQCYAEVHKGFPDWALFELEDKFLHKMRTSFNLKVFFEFLRVFEKKIAKIFVLVSNPEILFN
ncbi:hypothetical protein [Leptospira noguchii]|uniref:Uncharacterized protein n=1 Tax=Leptospira noguchii serovar Autumnalis str. ZUN142 TaxID=1085540 RepID=M6UAB6_9LEPT|nr:hypothetical protein [Leptospira noguchii]EMO41962.1 hypothetical protein LEP1GSC186_3446 [Leptospira noguchii serovar Autumnalis str. ZUN142]UOG50533.1 hypothetical protein MAL00_07240 [Leptospira noguchii]